MDGSFAIANSYADLWNGINASDVTGQNFLAVHLDENGKERLDERVRTGSNADGTAAGAAVLGSGGSVQTGRNFAPDFYGGLGGNSWMADWNAADAGRVYALSAPLTLQAPNTFTAWANANNATGQTPEQDHDNDGMPNGIEYFMGQSGSSFTAMPGLDGTNTVTWTMDPDYQGLWSCCAGLALGNGPPFRLPPLRNEPVLHCGENGGIAESGVHMQCFQALYMDERAVFAEPVEAFVKKARIMAGACF
jgi:hypothetical protein